MAIYYHGSAVLFGRFDLERALSGAGKVKFGYGVYLTNSFKSAAHYSGADPDAAAHYVYTVEVPELAEDNHIAFKQAVHQDVVARAVKGLGCEIPEKAVADGKEFRKFIARRLGSEKAASEFLLSIGVDFITWPYSWRNPDSGMNIAVLDDCKLRIVKVQMVELDHRRQLVAGSEREVEL